MVAWFALPATKTTKMRNMFGKVSRTINFRNSVVVACWNAFELTN